MTAQRIREPINRAGAILQMAAATKPIGLRQKSSGYKELAPPSS
jgi:hypothetical protein